MKKKILFLYLTLLVSILFADENQYKPIRIFSDIEPIIQDNISNFKITHINEIFPIGWSSDGKFAYIEYKIANGKPVIAYKLIIQDLVSDKIIWDSDYFDLFDLWNPYTKEEKKEYEKADSFLIEHNLHYESPEFYFLYNIEELGSALKQFNIIQSNSITLKIFPTEFENNTLESRRVIIEKRDESETYDETFFYQFYSYVIEVSKSSVGKKIIHSEEIVNNETFDTQVIGFFQSPFENRIAVILGTYQWSHHTGHNISFKFIGCDLNYGYK